VSLLVPGLAAAAGCLVAAAAVCRRRLCVVRVVGASMEPALRHGDRVLVARRRGRAVTRGQVVVVETPGRVGEEGWCWRMPAGRRADLHRTPWSVKRAVALAGDPVPAPLVEALGERPGARTPPGTLVALGDGACSVDSRQWGYVPVDRVLGVVLTRRRRAQRPATTCVSAATRR
jgi:signal peptidase I